MSDDEVKPRSLEELIRLQNHIVLHSKQDSITVIEAETLLNQVHTLENFNVYGRSSLDGDTFRGFLRVDKLKHVSLHRVFFSPQGRDSLQADNSKWRGVSLNHCHIQGASFRNTVFDYCRFYGTVFHDCNFYGASFDHSLEQPVYFENCNHLVCIENVPLAGYLNRLIGVNTDDGVRFSIIQHEENNKRDQFDFYHDEMLDWAKRVDKVGTRVDAFDHLLMTVKSILGYHTD